MDIPGYVSEKRKKVDRSLSGGIPEEPEWLYGMLSEYVSRGGKRLRPILCLSCAEACGGKEKDAMPYAVAVEFFHNLTLIHDDIEDDSSTRRGRPSLHKEFGVPTAINASDALYTAALLTILKGNPSAEKLKSFFGIVVKSFSEMVRGQGNELYWYRSGKFEISEKEYLEMAMGKTGALFGLSCRLGAHSTEASEKTQLAFEKFGENLGIAFQIRDDILNLTGNPQKFRKEIGEDVRESKRTLIISRLLKTLGKEEKKWLLSVLAKSEKSGEEVSRIISLAKESGAISYADSVASRFLEDAKRSLPPSLSAEKKELLHSLADHISAREG